MATLKENIDQTIEDFDSIKSAIKAKGVDVPAGTDTSEYATLISEIPTGADVDIVQGTGDSTTSVMSQDAVTNEIENLSTSISANSEAISELNKKIGSLPDHVGETTTITEYIAEDVKADVKAYVDEQIAEVATDGGDL